MSRAILLFCWFTLSSSLLLGQTRYYVNVNVKGGSGTGLSWINAFVDLQKALELAVAGDEVWVAKGVYFPTSTSNRDISFELKNGISIYGGFFGNESRLLERNYLTNHTVLSGDIGIRGDSTDNAYNVVYTSYTDTSAIMDGFHIISGQADYPGIDEPFYGRRSGGGGIYINGLNGSARPQIRHCIFENNYALNIGGAIFVNGNWNGSVSPVISHCTFFNNKAGRGGGAIGQEGGSFFTDIPNVIEHCKFVGNYGRLYGGAIYYRDGPNSAPIQIIDCYFSKNKTDGWGGGVYYATYYIYFKLDFLIQGSIFESNYAAVNGAAIGSPGGLTKATIRDCSFRNNKASIGVDGIIKISGGSLLRDSNLVENAKKYIFLVENCEFSGNDGFPISSSFNGHQKIIRCRFIANQQPVWLNEYNSITISECFFSNNKGSNGGGILANVNHNIIISNSLFYKNEAEKMGGAIYCSVGLELSIINSVFFENKAFQDGAITVNANESKNAKIINSVFFKNTANIAGAISGHNIAIFNSIFWGNQAEKGKIFNPSNQNVQLNNSLLDVESCAGIDNIDSLPVYGYIDKKLVIIGHSEVTGSFLCNNGMIFNQFPQFTDTTTFDFSLLPCSPARNGGDNTIVESHGITTDIVGNGRIQGGKVDMGAFESSSFSVNVTVPVLEPCDNIGSSSVSFNLKNGCPPYLLVWFGGNYISDTAVFSLPFAPGHYVITITDGRTEKDSINIEINEPRPLLVTATAAPVKCPGYAGSAGIAAEGGSPPYSYRWSNSDTSAAINKLRAGTYSVTVTDIKGCTAVDSVKVTPTGHLNLLLSTVPIQCHPNNGLNSVGSAAITPLNGTAPYTWLWKTGQKDSLLAKLTGGSYSVTVSDALGCTGKLEFTLPQPAELIASLSATDVSCIDSNDGTASVSVSGGTPGYTFNWSNAKTTPAITGLSPGWYSVTVVDANKCNDTTSVLIDPAPLFNIGIHATASLCFGRKDGRAAALIAGGKPPFTYLWNGGQKDSVLTDLPPGVYTVTITDAGGCVQQANSTIASSEAIQILYRIKHATSRNTLDGAVTVHSVLGVQQSHKFLWSNGATMPSLEGVPTGDYSLTITNTNGCFEVFHFTINIEGNKQGLKFQMLIVPNPSGQDYPGRLWLEVEQPQMLDVKVFDSYGRAVSAESFFAAFGKTVRTLPDGLAPAVYWVVVRGETGSTATLKWVVIDR